MEKLLEKSNTGSRCGWFVGLLAVTLVASVSAAPNKKLENKSPDAPSAQVNTAVPMNSAQAAKQKAQSKLMSMPLAFEENIGQIEAPVKYVGRAKNYVVFLKPDGTVVSIKGDGRLQMKLQNANSSAQLLGEDRQKSYSNYYIGNDRSKWFEHVSQFGKVRYHNVYSGIDVVYHADERQIEYDFVVKPGTDPNQIRMVFEGADSMAINKGGDLELQTAAGTTINHKPVVYQMINGQRRLVEGAFTLAENRVSFKIGEYDRTQPLVIDPSLQVLAFFGGIMNDEGAAIAANNTCVCFTGRTQSASLPGGTRPNNGINWDVFVTALNPGAVGVPESAGTTVLWTTYLSGVGDQAGRGIAVDNKGVTSGNVYVAGYTNSSNFAGAALPANNYDAFVSILSSAGALSKTVLYGGPGADQALSIALDYSTFTTSPNFANITNPASDPTVVPNVVIGGFTNGGITPQPTGFQKNFNQCTAGGGGLAFCNHFAANGTAPLIDDPQGSIDGFVAEFNNGLTLLSATYLGGGGIDQVNGVAVDNGGNIYAAGVTQPGIAPFFPVVNGLSSAINGGGPGVANAGTNGGPAFCASPVGIAALGAPPAVLNGIPPCFQANYDNYRGPLGGISAFVVKFRATTTLTAISNDLKTLANSALFGGNAGGEQAIGIAVDQNGLPNTFTNPPTAFANPPAGQVSPSTVTIRPACFTFATPVPPAACLAGSAPLLLAGPTPITALLVSNAFGLGVGLGTPLPPVTVPTGETAQGPGYQPGLTGPRVYVVGNTLNFDFAGALTTGLTCLVAPALAPLPPPGGVFPTPVAPDCTHAIPVTGGAVQGDAGDIGTPVGSPPDGPQILPIPGGARITSVGGVNSGQSQGWLATFNFPDTAPRAQGVATVSGGAVTAIAVSNGSSGYIATPSCTITGGGSNVGTNPVLPPGQGATCTTTLTNGVVTAITVTAGGSGYVNPPTVTIAPPPTAVFQPPTVPNYLVLQPPTCNQDVNCVQAGALSPNGQPPALTVTPPSGFFGSWNAVAVDLDQQVYVIGQMGMSTSNGSTGTVGGPTFTTVPGIGPPNRLALEIERISTTGVPEAIFAGPLSEIPATVPLQETGVPNQSCNTGIVCAPPLTFTSSYIVDVTSAATGTAAGGAGTVGPACGAPAPPLVFNSPFFPPLATFGPFPTGCSNYGQFAGPIVPDPNEPLGLGNGIAVNPLREAFFVGTSTAWTVSFPPVNAAAIVVPACGTTLANPPTSCWNAALPGTLVVGANAAQSATVPSAITETGAIGANYVPGTVGCTVVGGGGNGGACSCNAIASATAGGTVNRCWITAAGTAFATAPSMQPASAPSATTLSSTYDLSTTPLEPSIAPTLGTLNGLCTTLPAPGTQCTIASGGSNVSRGGGAAPFAFEDVIYGAIQFYDDIATPTTFNFTTTVNGPIPSRQVVTFTDWQNLPVTILPGCTISPREVGDPRLAPGSLVNAGGGSFTFTQIGNTAVWQIDPTAVAVTTPGVITEIIDFDQTGPCAGTGGGITATATATITPPAPGPGVVTLLTLTNNGTGYAPPPAAPPGCAITGGGGAGATCTVTVGAGGSIVAITLTAPGAGYTSNPAVTIGAPPLGGNPVIDEFDPITVTLTVLAPINLSPQQSFGTANNPLTMKLASGIIDQYLASGVQVVANQVLGPANGFNETSFNIGVTTSVGTVNFTAQIVGNNTTTNWDATAARCFAVNPAAPGVAPLAYTVPLVSAPASTVYSTTAPAQTNVPVVVDTGCLSSLPIGIYTASIVFLSTPETPGLLNGNPPSVPITFSVTSNPVAAPPIPIVFGASTAPQQTGLAILNPLDTRGGGQTFNFTAGYVPNNVYGSPLPPAYVSFVQGSLVTPAGPAGVPNSISGSVPPGGQNIVTVQVTPCPTGVGCLPNGVWTGQLLVSGNNNFTGATPQTTVPFIVYVGGNTAQQPNPSGIPGQLGLMLPVNTPTIVTGFASAPCLVPTSLGLPFSPILPGQCPVTPGTQGASLGAYPIQINVGAGYNDLQLPNPSIIQITGLNNTSTTPFVVNVPNVVSAALPSVPGSNPLPVGAVTVEALGTPIGVVPVNNAAICLPGTWAVVNSLANSPLGAQCAWQIVVDSTLLAGGTANPQGITQFTGNITFTANPAGNQFAPLTVPIIVNVAPFPQLEITQPSFFPNPTFGTGIPNPPPVPGFAQTIIGTPLPVVSIPCNVIQNPNPSGPPCINGLVNAPNTVILSAPGGNSTLACSVIMINATSGTFGPPFTGGVQQVTIAPFASNAPWVSVALAPAAYLGVVPGGGTQGVVPGGFGPIPGVPPFPAGPATVGGGLQAIQICANPSSLPAVPGTYFTSVAFNGAGVSNVVPSCVVGNQLGQTCVNVEFLVSGGGVAPTKAIFGEIGITRNTPAGAPTFSNLLWVLDANGNNAFDPAVCTGPPQNSCTGDKFKFFGLNGDTPVTGDWDGTGVIRMAIFRCTLPSATVPAPGFCQFFIDLNNSGTFDGTFGGDAILTFGLPGDVPVVGDWNGSGTTKIGVFRNSASAASGAACPAPSAAGTLQPMCWIVDVGPGVAGLPPSVALTSGANAFDPTGLYTKTYYYGNPGDKPVVSNWSGASTPNGPVDGVGVFTCPTAGSNCTWTVSSSGTNMPIAGDAKFTFGVGGTDQPIVGNWGANPLTKKRIGVLRTASVTVPCPAITTGPQTGTVSNSCWIVDTNGSGVLDLTDQVYQFGAPGDVPVVGFWTMP